MVFERFAETGERQGAVTRIARQPGIGPDSRLRLRPSELLVGEDPSAPDTTACVDRVPNGLGREVREPKGPPSSGLTTIAGRRDRRTCWRAAVSRAISLVPCRGDPPRPGPILMSA
jgi:hypothetical protein